jgi:uncharacterized UPF0160 family protein
MDFVEFFVNGVIIMILIHVGLNMLTRVGRRHADSDLEEVSKDLELERLIPLTVEVVDNQYFCYNSITQDFVCQGVNLVEIVKKFKQRYPEKSAAIYDGDETAVRTLKSQLKELDENSSSIRYTS